MAEYEYLTNEEMVYARGVTFHTGTALSEDSVMRIIVFMFETFEGDRVAVAMPLTDMMREALTSGKMGESLKSLADG